MPLLKKLELLLLDQERESSESPMLNAFCRVAPSVRFKVRAMLATRVFFLASVFNVRTCSVVHARRFPPPWSRFPSYVTFVTAVTSIGFRF